MVCETSIHRDTTPLGGGRLAPEVIAEIFGERFAAAIGNCQVTLDGSCGEQLELFEQVRKV